MGTQGSGHCTSGPQATIESILNEGSQNPGTVTIKKTVWWLWDHTVGVFLNSGVWFFGAENCLNYVIRDVRFDVRCILRLTSASEISSYGARNRKTVPVRDIRIGLSGIVPLRCPDRPERQNVAEVFGWIRTTFWSCWQSPNHSGANAEEFG